MTQDEILNQFTKTQNELSTLRSMLVDFLILKEQESKPQRPAQDIRDLPPLQMVEEIGNHLMRRSRVITGDEQANLNKAQELREFQLDRGYLSANQMESLIDIYRQVFGESSQ